MSERLCACHGEPMYWTRDKRYRAGGFWRCAVKERARARNLYNRDPLYRIPKLFKNAAQKRAKRLDRAHERLEAMRGSLSPQGQR